MARILFSNVKTFPHRITSRGPIYDEVSLLGLSSVELQSYQGHPDYLSLYDQWRSVRSNASRKDYCRDSPPEYPRKDYGNEPSSNKLLLLIGL